MPAVVMMLLSFNTKKKGVTMGREGWKKVTGKEGKKRKVVERERHPCLFVYVYVHMCDWRVCTHRHTCITEHLQARHV